MTNSNDDVSAELASTSSDGGIGNGMSRRDVLQLAGGTVSLAAVVGGPAHATTTTKMAAATKQEAAPMSDVQLTINGEVRRLTVDSRQSILDLLRETLDLTGTKKGCNQGACGACTILMNGQRMVSCLTLAIMHDGAEITTIEGLAKGEELHPLQAAFIDHEGFQCGYCTSGQIMSGLGCIAEGHAVSPDEIKFWMSGNICRCGAYPGIVAAIGDTVGRS